MRNNGSSDSFLGKPFSDDLSQMWAFAVEISRPWISFFLWKGFGTLVTCSRTDAASRASRLSCALASQEDSIITHVEQELAISVPGATVVSLQFDGLVMQTPKATVDDVTTVFAAMSNSPAKRLMLFRKTRMRKVVRESFACIASDWASCQFAQAAKKYIHLDVGERIRCVMAVLFGACSVTGGSALG